MLILDAEKIREWDLYTIQNEPITSIELMERASVACADWILEFIKSNNNPQNTPAIHIFCGKGNNGGDGLAIARLLYKSGQKVIVYILEFGHLGTDDFQVNLQRLHELPIEIKFLSTEITFPPIEPGEIIIDALFGSGLNRPPEGISKKLINHLNGFDAIRISIDVPSGLYIDQSGKGNSIIRATHTLSFQCMKPVFLVAEGQQFTGEVHILDIGLHKGFESKVYSPNNFVGQDLIRSIYRPRSPFAHKGNFGHALLLAGSFGKMGAAVLSAKACLRSGAGLTSLYIPGCGYNILQSVCPEAMVITDPDFHKITTIPGELNKYQVIGIGPGIGTDEKTASVVLELLKNYTGKLVIDADALNIISKDLSVLKSCRAKIILTPHPKEFSRLFGESENDFDRINLCKKAAAGYGVVIILKGRYSLIATPGGMLHINPTGNPGMAKGGSGDALTGILTALMAQGYEPEFSAILGCYIHGLAGDLAAEKYGQESMIASDLTEEIGGAFKHIN
jgi:NAD(P)H-hydrate epimerase